MGYHLWSKYQPIQELVMFTKKRLPNNLRKPKLDGVVMNFSQSAKYLGVIIDSKLTWVANAEERVKKSLTAFYACKSTFGKSWGLSPKMILWIYTAIIRPILMYGALVWWYSLCSGNVLAKLAKVQRQVCIACTGALKTTSN